MPLYAVPLHGRIVMLRLFCYVFAHEFLFNSQFDVEPDYIVRKPILHRIQWYILRGEILSTFHTRVDNRSIRHFCIVFTSKLPFPFDDHHQNLMHPYRARPHSPSQTASRSNQPCCHCSHVRTDRWDKRKLYPISAPLIERRANNIAFYCMPVLRLLCLLYLFRAVVILCS